MCQLLNVFPSVNSTQSESVLFSLVEHDTKIIDSYLNRMNTIFKKIKQCEENQNVKEYLNSPVCHSGFKRLN